MTSLFLLCAGSGDRFDPKLAKALFPIENKELFLYSLKTFLSIKEINNFYLVIDKKNEKLFSKVLTRENIKNVVLLAGSDKSRHDSLVCAFKQAKPNGDDLIITHDCARPCVTKSIILENIKTAKKHNFASTQIPLVDSLFEKKAGVFESKSRKNLFQIQTPQTFKFSLWSNAKCVNKEITDAFSFLNISIKENNVVIGSPKNYKITFKSDLG